MRKGTKSRQILPGCKILTVLMGAALWLGVWPTASSGQPSWFKEPGLHYPADRYLIGTGIGQSAEKDERFHIAQENARLELVKVIRVQISAQFLNEVVETSHGIDEITQSRIVSNTDLEVDGIEVVKKKEDKHIVYSLAVLDKEQGRVRQQAKIDQLDLRLEQGWNRAQLLEEGGQNEQALQAYLKLNPLLNRRDEALTVVLALSQFTGMAYEMWAKTLAASPVQRTMVDQAIGRLTTGDFQDLGAAATALGFRLQQQLDVDKQVLVQPFTYGETPATSPFSRHLAGLLRDRLTQAGLTVVAPVRGETPQTANHAQSLARQAGADIVLRGGYLQQQDQVQVFARAADLETGLQLAAAEVAIPLELVQAAGLTVQPQNFAALMQDLGVFRTDELIPGNLQVEVWTDRGSESLLLEEDEEITLAVRVNQPCYVQMVYHLADRKRVLLYNNHYIDQAKANHAVALPDTFSVAAPFGAEFLQVFARTERFPEVPVRYWHGYQVLVDDLQVYIDQTRGLKKKTKQVEQAETRLAFTTMAR
ncbi:MAG: DUF4384 domain-containing protein [Candidatus Latescibacteria bacterium]|nr:DUF4384 domain-containing protein [Candidatus Latescibacterota bacterium]